MEKPKAHRGLVVIGCVFLVSFVALLTVLRFSGTETKEFKPNGDLDKRTTTVGPPSDAVLLALLGAGLVMLAAGIFYARIQSISLPGGAKLELTPSEVQTVLTHAQRRAREENVAEDDIPILAASALESIREQKSALGGQSLPDNAIDNSVRQVISRYRITQLNPDEDVRGYFYGNFRNVGALMVVTGLRVLVGSISAGSTAGDSFTDTLGSFLGVLERSGAPLMLDLAHIESVDPKGSGRLFSAPSLVIRADDGTDLEFHVVESLLTPSDSKKNRERRDEAVTLLRSLIHHVDTA